MIERGDKKGLSTVVTNLLLILLVLVAVGVVWVVVRGILSEGAGEIEISQFTFDLQIQNAYVSGTDVVVTIKRNAGGGELSGMKFQPASADTSYFWKSFLRMKPTHFHPLLVY